MFNIGVFTKISEENIHLERMTSMEDMENPLRTDKQECYTCYNSTTCYACCERCRSKASQGSSAHNAQGSAVVNESTDKSESCRRCDKDTDRIQSAQMKQMRRTKVDLVRKRLNSRLRSSCSTSLFRLKFKGMSHLLLISIFLVSSFLCSLVNGEEEIKQSSPFLDSQKASKLGELWQRIQAAKQAFDRERMLEAAAMSKDGNLYEYLGDNLGSGSESADLPVLPPGYRVRLISTPGDTGVGGIVRGEDDWYGKDNKRGNYMTLCHFKICNMGRKRWKSWP